MRDLPFATQLVETHKSQNLHIKNIALANNFYIQTPFEPRECHHLNTNLRHSCDPFYDAGPRKMDPGGGSELAVHDVGRRTLGVNSA